MQLDSGETGPTLTAAGAPSGAIWAACALKNRGRTAADPHPTPGAASSRALALLAYFFSYFTTRESFVSSATCSSFRAFPVKWTSQ